MARWKCDANARGWIRMMPICLRPSLMPTSNLQRSDLLETGRRTPSKGTPG